MMEAVLRAGGGGGGGVSSIDPRVDRSEGR